MKTLANDCKKISEDISNYLVNYLREFTEFQTRSFYGESFTLNLLARTNLLTTEIKKNLINAYLLKDKLDSQFHFEFNNYAFSDYCKKFHDEELRQLFIPLKFKGTPCTNWTLLRSNVRFAENIDFNLAWSELKNKIYNSQETSGLILDDPGVKSFQYHCFSAAMLIEIYEKTNDHDTYLAFFNAVNFIRKFILTNGEAIYIGRGQEQSFGLGVLVYILSKYYAKTNEDDVLLDIKNILNFIKSFQYKSGAFPLVFTGNEPAEPKDVDMYDPAFCGWYPYNNYFDYLPFLGFFLHKTFEVLNSIPNFQTKKLDLSKLNKINYRDNSFMIEHKKKYTAIVSRPGGYWSNDLSIPLIMYKGNFITPLLGGEQFQKSLYSQEFLSLPVTSFGHFSWRKFGTGKYYGNSLLWISFFGVMVRKYVFAEDFIEVRNYSFSWFPSLQSFSFKDNLEQKNSKEFFQKDYKVIFSTDVKNISKGYSATGPLKILKTNMNTKIMWELN